jgi:hypothetical protein
MGPKFFVRMLGEAVALQDVAEFVFAEYIGPDVR